MNARLQVRKIKRIQTHTAVDRQVTERRGPSPAAGRLPEPRSGLTKGWNGTAELAVSLD